jgi:hypothetical protein
MVVLLYASNTYLHIINKLLQRARKGLQDATAGRVPKGTWLAIRYHALFKSVLEHCLMHRLQTQT